MRRWRDRVLLLLGVVCVTYWFGNSGAGLFALWLECRRRRRVSERSDVDTTWVERIDDDRLDFAHVGAWRVVVIGERCGRREVFRDELSEAAWVRLRRRCLAAQPATGRSTSI